MLFIPADFADIAFNPNDKFTSSLPSSSLLRDTTLDPGLSTEPPGVTGRNLKKLLVKQATTDVLQLQQRLFYGIATHTGALSHYEGVLGQAMGIVQVAGNLSTDEMAEQMVLTGIGLATNVLSSIPNVYTQIASSVIGFGLMLYDIFKGEPERLPEYALPMQQYEEDTDADQFNTMVQAAIAGANSYTSLFAPRLRGDVTAQYRKNDNGQFGIAFGLGDGHSSDTAQFHGTGDLGFIPGGRRITSVIQTRWPELPNEHPPYIESRCGGCTGSALTLTRDVGTFYPATNNGLLSLWNHCMKLGPAMYNLDTHRLQSAWADHTEAWADGLAFAWNYKAEKDKWGTGAWRCAVRGATQQNTVGLDNKIGVLSYTGPFDGCSNDWDKDSFRKTSIYRGIIKPALAQMLEAQRYYLDATTIAAYLPANNDASANDDLRTRILDAQNRILATAEKYEVRRKDVVDPQYAQALEDAGAFVPSPQRTFAIATKTKEPDNGLISGLPLKPDMPPPPVLPTPSGGNPFGEYIPKKKKGKSRAAPLAAVAAAGAGLFLVTR